MKLFAHDDQSLIKRILQPDSNNCDCRLVVDIVTHDANDISLCLCPSKRFNHPKPSTSTHAIDIIQKLLKHYQDLLNKPLELAMMFTKENYETLYTLAKHFDRLVKHFQRLKIAYGDLESILKAAKEQSDPFILEVIKMGLAACEDPSYSKAANEILKASPTTNTIEEAPTTTLSLA